MSLSNQDANQLRTRLNRNTNLSIKSKTILNTFINNKKNAFDRSTFMQQYNAKMRNLRSKEPSLGKRKRSPGNLNSAMEINNGNVSGGSVNPNKRSRMSPRGPLSGVSGASNTSNNENNASTNENLTAIARRVGRQLSEEEPVVKKQKTATQPPLVTAAQAFQRKQKENFNKLRTKRNSLPRGLFGVFSNVRLRNAVNQGKYQNINTQLNSTIKLANSHEKQIKNQMRNLPNGNFKNNIGSKINNVIGNNSKTKALLQRIKTEQNGIKAKAQGNISRTINNNKNVEDVINLLLSKDQLIEIARNLKMTLKAKMSVPAIRNMIMKHPKKDELKVEINKQVVGNNESIQITEKVNSYISGINNQTRTRPTYTASLVILYIKDLPRSERQKLIADGSILPQLMNGINRRTMSTNKINFEKNITREQFTDLVFIMWLDGVHDEYITTTLDVWFNESTLFTPSQKKLIVNGWKTDFITTINGLQLPKGKGKTNILTSSLTNFASGWEKTVKEYLITKHKSNINTISTSLGKQVTTNTPQNINIAIDQQYRDNNEYSISRFIREHKPNKNSKTNVNTLITYSQAFDPGRSLVSGGVHQDIEMLTLNNLSRNFISANKKYYLCDININLKVDKTSVYNLQVKKNTTNNVDVSFNNKKIVTGISGGQAGKAKGDVIAVSKYFGDALQYYSLAVMDDIQRSSKTERFFFGSGDSMALLGYDRVCEIFNKKTRMVVDFPTQYKPRIYVVGMNASVQNRPQPSVSMMTGTGAKNNNKNGEMTSKQ
jgi:predicted RNA binding protein with dsRBD fold (UPF0201 family)